MPESVVVVVVAVDPVSWDPVVSISVVVAAVGRVASLFVAVVCVSWSALLLRVATASTSRSPNPTVGAANAAPQWRKNRAEVKSKDHRILASFFRGNSLIEHEYLRMAERFRLYEPCQPRSHVQHAIREASRCRSRCRTRRRGWSVHRIITASTERKIGERRVVNPWGRRK